MIKQLRYYTVLRLCSLFLLCGFIATGSQADDDWIAPPEAGELENPVRYDVDSVAAGKRLFSKYCLECHGYWGEGDGITGLVLDDRPANLLKLSGTQSHGAFFWKIREGRNTMPAFNEEMLSDTEVWQIINFVASLENEIGSESQQSVVVSRCASCHGLGGTAMLEGWPDLPEMTQQELENKLFAHRAGLIPDSTMSQVTFDLTDEEIREAARYFSSLNQIDNQSNQ